MKFNIFSFLVFITGLAISLAVGPVSKANQHYETDLVMFGDSITYGGDWQKLFPDLKVVNLGVPGDTTHNLSRRMGQVFKYKPKYCIVMSGFNDLDNNYTFDEIYTKYTIVLEKLKQKNITPIIMSTTYTADYFRPNYFINKKIYKLNNFLKEYAHNNDVIFVDLNKYLSKNGHLKREYAKDHVHLNEKAYEIWRDELKKILGQELSK